MADKPVESDDVRAAFDKWDNRAVIPDHRPLLVMPLKDGAEDALVEKGSLGESSPLSASSAILAQVPVPQGERSTLQVPKTTQLRACSPSRCRPNSASRILLFTGICGWRTVCCLLASSITSTPSLIRRADSCGTRSRPKSAASRIAKNCHRSRHQTSPYAPAMEERGRGRARIRKRGHSAVSR